MLLLAALGRHQSVAERGERLRELGQIIVLQPEPCLPQKSLRCGQRRRGRFQREQLVHIHCYALLLLRIGHLHSFSQPDRPL
jgi:hypothetical protein